MPLRGNSPPVPGRKYNSGCKCGASRSESNRTIASGNCSILFGICFSTQNKSCARQAAKPWRKSPKGFFDNLKRRPGGEPGRRFGRMSHIWGDPLPVHQFTPESLSFSRGICRIGKLSSNRWIPASRNSFRMIPGFPGNCSCNS